MTILVDSASLDDLTAATELGFVRGFTTNPTLMARETRDPLTHFERLLTAFAEGPAFYQPTRTTPAGMDVEARAAAALEPARVVIKLPATPDGVALAPRLTAAGIRCALTAVYSPAQAVLAHETGCAWAIPYVDRAARNSLGEIVVELAAVLARLRSSTRILAASLKTSAQVASAIRDGADDVTASAAVLRGLAEHPLTEAAVREFAAHWEG